MVSSVDICGEPAFLASLDLMPLDPYVMQVWHSTIGRVLSIAREIVCSLKTTARRLYVASTIHSCNCRQLLSPCNTAYRIECFEGEDNATFGVEGDIPNKMCMRCHVLLRNFHVDMKHAKVFRSMCKAWDNVCKVRRRNPHKGTHTFLTKLTSQ